jgi:hypothetical protein
MIDFIPGEVSDHLPGRVKASLLRRLSAMFPEMTDNEIEALSAHSAALVWPRLDLAALLYAAAGLTSSVCAPRPE